MSERAVHVGGCNALCDGDEHYLARDWQTAAEHTSAVAEADRRMAIARLATREALALIRKDRP